MLNTDHPLTKKERPSFRLTQKRSLLNVRNTVVCYCIHSASQCSWRGAWRIWHRVLQRRKGEGGDLWKLTCNQLSVANNCTNASWSFIDGDFNARLTVIGFGEPGETDVATIRTINCKISDPRCPKIASMVSFVSPLEFTYLSTEDKVPNLPIWVTTTKSRLLYAICMISVGKPPTVPTARRVWGPLPQPLFAVVAAGDDNKDAMSSARNKFVARELAGVAKAGRGGMKGAAGGLLHHCFAGRRPWSMALISHARSSASMRRQPWRLATALYVRLEDLKVSKLCRLILCLWWNERCQIRQQCPYKIISVMSHLKVNYSAIAFVAKKFFSYQRNRIFQPHIIHLPPWYCQGISYLFLTDR